MKTLILKPFLWGLLTLMVVTGCQAQVISPQSSTTTTLTLETTPQTNGEYVLKGTTNLPDQTQLTAIAVRNLAINQPINGDNAEIYSILAYQPTIVEDGQWTARFKIWQVAEDGRYQEAWQPQLEALNLEATPNPTVQFAITLAPPHFFAARQTMLTQSGVAPVVPLHRQTDQGEPFLWASEQLPVALPTGKTMLPTEVTAQVNGGWGDRYRLVDEPPLPYLLTPEDERQTNAPPRPEEFLQ
jgi:hypothetical protein